MNTSSDRSGAPGHPRLGTLENVETTDPADRAAFGEFLRQARERRQLTLQEIADDTKISSKHLTALEQGNVKSLPGGMYRRAMLRAYAESVGLDKGAALEQFERTFEPRARGGSLPAAAPDHVPPPRPQSRPRDARVLLIVVGLAATAVVALVTGDAGQGEADPPAPVVTPASVGTPAPAVTPASVGTSAPRVSSAQVATEAPVTGAAPVGAVRPAVVTSTAQRPPAGRRVDIDANAVTASGRAAATGAPPRAPVASGGQLMIVTEPAGARVTINGTGWGVTPVTVPHLPFGSKRVRVTMGGYASQERVVNLSPERPAATLTVTLARD